jgi:hypothetical protein
MPTVNLAAYDISIDCKYVAQDTEKSIIILDVPPSPAASVHQLDVYGQQQLCLCVCYDYQNKQRLFPLPVSLFNTNGFYWLNFCVTYLHKFDA